MRSPYPLEHFYGITESYVYHNGDGVEDYGDDYENNPSFIELIGRFIESGTGDEKYANKIVKVLAKKLGCEHLLREHPLTRKERAIEDKMLMRAFTTGTHRAANALKIAKEIFRLPDMEDNIVDEIYRETHLSREEYKEYIKTKRFEMGFK
jgi:hypothetical protein